MQAAIRPNFGSNEFLSPIVYELSVSARRVFNAFSVKKMMHSCHSPFWLRGPCTRGSQVGPVPTNAGCTMPAKNCEPDDSGVRRISTFRPEEDVTGIMWDKATNPLFPDLHRSSGSSDFVRPRSSDLRHQRQPAVVRSSQSCLLL